MTSDQIEHWATEEGYNASLQHLPVLGSEASFSTIVNSDNPSWLFRDGGAIYKAFFTVRARKIEPFPIAKE